MLLMEQGLSGTVPASQPQTAFEVGDQSLPDTAAGA